LQPSDKRQEQARRSEALRARWGGLGRFLDDGPPFALDQLNTSLRRPQGGADNWAVIVVLIECRKLNAVNPHGWLTDTLTSLAHGHPADRVAELMT